MKIEEVFDKSYDLTMSGSVVDAVKAALTNDGIVQSMVYQNQNNPDEVFISMNVNGAWEVHHNIFDRNTGKFVSGKRLGKTTGANPRFISTALNLYKNRLSKGHSIRVVGTPDVWPTYEKAIEHILLRDKNQYDFGSVTTSTNKDGEEIISQVISPKGKLESLNKNILNILSSK